MWLIILYKCLGIMCLLIFSLSIIVINIWCEMWCSNTVSVFEYLSFKIGQLLYMLRVAFCVYTLLFWEKRANVNTCIQRGDSFSMGNITLWTIFHVTIKILTIKFLMKNNGDMFGWPSPLNWLKGKTKVWTHI